MRKSSGSFAYEDMLETALVWGGTRWFHIGDRVKWCGMLLRCQVDHYCGHEAAHPWDPGWGWGDAAALMWRVLYPEFVSEEVNEVRAAVEADRAAQSAALPAAADGEQEA